MKRIEISGFKSFADKTDFVLGEGLTAVVGPNGSGKSNLAEAVKWVLGEQSARLLRGTRMDDVIFCGTARRKAVGMAEVTLVFDNGDRSLPLDMSEVAITRRAYRSGDGEYFINRKPCRLRDISELFLDTGIGKDSYSFVGQGRIEEILSSDPRNRRVIFEEAAGISRYKLRKRETEARLNETASNMLRIKDIAWELESQLAPLLADAERATAYLELTRQKDEIDRELLLYELSLAERQRLTVQTQYERVNLDILHQESLHSINEATLATRSLEASVELAVLRDKERELSHQALMCEQKTERLNDSAAELSRAQSQLESARRTAQALQEEEAKLVADLTVRTEAWEGLQAVLREKTHELATYESGGHESSGHAGQDCEQDLTTIDEEILALRGRMAELESLIKVSQQIIDGKVDQKETLVGRQECFQLKLRDDQAATLRWHRQLAEKQHEYEQLRKLRSEHDSSQVRLEQSRRKADAARHEAECRWRALEASDRQMEGLSRGARFVLSAQLPGVLGALGNIISTDQSYEMAIEVALGGQAGDIVTQTEAIARQAITMLKSRAEGRATFLPLDTLRARQLREVSPSAQAVTGFMGRAIDLVRAAPEVTIAVRHALGNVLVCEGLDSAAQVAAQTGYSWKIVTLDGDILAPGGTITGGSRPERQAWLLSRRRELTNAAAEFEERKKIATALEHELAVAQAQGEQLRTAMADLTKVLADTKTALADCAHALERSEEGVAQLALTLSAIESELAELSTEREKCFAERLLAETNLKELNERREQLVVLIQERAQHDAHSHALRIELAVEVSRLESQIAVGSTQIENLARELFHLRERLFSAEQTIREHTSVVTTLQARVADLESEIESLEKTAAEARAGRERARLQHEIKEGEIQQLKTQAGDIMAELSSVKQRRHNIELRRERVLAEEQFLREKLLHKYPEYRDAESKLASRGEAETQIKELERKIADLGPVRVASIEESERLRSRLDFLGREQDDLREAERKLRDVMSELDKTMGDRFLTGFAAVQARFAEVATRLFGGGTARVYLSDPTQPLDSGIEVDLQPPGKRLQSITLLSGGERALAALSLLCAVLRVKPTPFCVLDEIDAPLDEANVERLVVVLRELSLHTQFLLITHTRGTMMAADLLYGVTMPEDGVSKVLAVRVAEIAGA